MLNASVDKKKFSDPIYLFFTRSLSSLLLRGITLRVRGAVRRVLLNPTVSFR